MMFQISTFNTIWIGCRVSEKATEYASTRGWKRIGILLDGNVYRQHIIREFLERVVGEVLTIKIKGEPTYEFIDDVASGCRYKDYDCIFGIGGGSILDISKAVGVLMANPGKAIDYRGMDKVKNKGVDVCLFPTTAGTGSEATRTASFIDSNEKTKLGINGRFVECTAAFLDPEFTVEAPWNVTLSAGLDVMVHAIEAVSAKNTMHYSALLGAKAVAIAMEALRKIKTDPKNLVWRERQLLASYYAGVAMFHSQGGIASAISYPLGVHFNVPHGIAGGIFMPHEIAFNVERGFTGYSVCADALGLGFGKSAIEKSRLFADEYAKFHAYVTDGLTLADFKVAEMDLTTLKKLTMDQRKGCLDLNPVAADECDVEWFLNKAFGL